MKIGLIAMSGVRVRTAELAALGITLPDFVRRGRVIAQLPSLGLLTVVGLTSPGHEVTYLEIDDLQSLGTLPEFDLVGISSFTARIDAAYELAGRWDRCTLSDVTFVPKRMPVEELEPGLRWLFEGTYSRPATEARLQSFVAQRRDARWAARRAVAQRAGPSAGPAAAASGGTSP